MEKKISGIYVLFISARRSILLKVGALGKIKLSKGTYAYVGSAQNGIKMRIARHLFKIEKPALFGIMEIYGGDPWLTLRTFEQKRPELNLQKTKYMHERKSNILLTKYLT